MTGLLTPVFELVSWTFTLLFWLGGSRYLSIRNRDVRISDIALGQPAWPRRLTQIDRAYHNQFELPLLFYALVCLVIVTGAQPAGFLTPLRRPGGAIDTGRKPPRRDDLVPVDGELGSAGGEAPGKGGRNLDHFCFRVEPFDEPGIRRHLDANGIEAGPTRFRYGAEGDGPSIYVTDPERNVVELKGPQGR